MPKSTSQCIGEINTVKKFLLNFCSDQVRFMNNSIGIPGDHIGQNSISYRFPYGKVAIISPFNFPLEIPTLQLIGSLFMGNKPILKCAFSTQIVMEQMIRLLIKCGMPSDDVILLNCSGSVMNLFLKLSQPSLTQFTGSQNIAEKLSVDMKGKIRLEDAGFNWKILGPDVHDFDYVAWQCDLDAYAASGQKCSKTSILFIHENWYIKII